MAATSHPPLRFPRAPLFALGGLVIASVLTVTAVRVTGVGVVQVPDASAIAVREFHFEDRTDGGITVSDAASRQVVALVEPGTNGFLRGTMRGLARERKRQDIGPDLPFLMVGRADGKLTLEDPGTGRRVDLGSFGPTNSAVFAQIMTHQGPPLVITGPDSPYSTKAATKADTKTATQASSNTAAITEALPRPR